MSFRRTLRRKVLRGLGPLMGLLALGSPMFAEPAASWLATRGASAGPSVSASERRLLRMNLVTAMASAMTADSSRFLRTLLGFAATRSGASLHVRTRPQALLGLDALRRTPLRGSVWMVRNPCMVLGGVATGIDAPYSSLLRC